MVSCQAVLHVLCIAESCVHDVHGCILVSRCMAMQRTWYSVSWSGLMCACMIHVSKNAPNGQRQRACAKAAGPVNQQEMQICSTKAGLAFQQLCEMWQ